MLNPAAASVAIGEPGRDYRFVDGDGSQSFEETEDPSESDFTVLSFQDGYAHACSKRDAVTGEIVTSGAG